MTAAVLHLDESCLGNGREGANPGGGGGLIETRDADGTLHRHDVYIHAPATTNNRMALSGALTALELLSELHGRSKVVVVSDSEYLVKGMREWVPGWIARGWKRKTGEIENLALWQSLVSAAKRHDVQWTWVRGHRGHPKNEYANDLAVMAAKEQRTSEGAVPSGFWEWLERKRDRGLFRDYDPDETFEAYARRINAGERLALREEEES